LPVVSQVWNAVFQYATCQQMIDRTENSPLIHSGLD